MSKRKSKSKSRHGKAWQNRLVAAVFAATASMIVVSNFAAASDSNDSELGESDAPRSVPENLTAKEYYDLARQYGWSRPKHALQCVEKIEKNGSGSSLAIEVRRWKDSVLPKKIPPVEAIKLAWKAENAWQDPDKPSNWYIGAQKYATQCIEKYPDFEYGYISLANLQALDEKRDQAAETYRQALKINPHNVQALDGLGDALLWLDQTKEAR